MKKLLLSLGSIAVLATPLVGVVSCKDDSGYSYNASDKSISLGIHASINSLHNVALSYGETSKVAGEIARGIHDHTDIDKINISYSVEGDSSRNKTVTVTPADMFGFWNVCGSVLKGPDGSTLPPITFYEVDLNHGFAGVVATTGDTKLKSLVNASQYVTANILFAHSVNPSDTAATDAFREKINNSNRETIISYFIVWQSLKGV